MEDSPIGHLSADWILDGMTASDLCPHNQICVHPIKSIELSISEMKREAMEFLAVRIKALALCSRCQV